MGCSLISDDYQNQRGVRPQMFALAKRTLFALAKPMVVPPLPIGFLAPLLSVAAGLLAWGAVSVATDEWFSMPGHLFLTIGIGFAGGYFCWHYLTDKGGTTPFRRVATFALGSLLYLLLRGADLPREFGPWARSVWVGVLSASSVLVSLWGVTAISIRSGRGRRLTFLGLTVLIPALLASTLTALASVLFWPGDPLTGWAAAGILYATIAWETIMLTRYFPDPPSAQSSKTRGER
ncbi:hypothetical protein DMC63_36015 [Streptomyces sp. WAC 05977]|nr:hypothetical protein DMC63_36015 [Streptomyces sp. WAC 05977]